MPTPAPRTVLHLDMDAFYAAIEQRDRPELRGRPVVVGADPRGGRGRGVVSTASYEARRFGIGSAMPISTAYRLCPNAVYLPPDMPRYVAVSKQVMAILRDLTDRVEPVSIDEAFLDVSDSLARLGTGRDVAFALKRRIHAATALTASVGVATSKLVAKIASDMRKPDGLVVVPPGDEPAFLAPLPARRLWGVGPKLDEQLAALGIATIGDLAACPASRLRRRLGSHGLELQLLARGVDRRPVRSDGGPTKSVGQEHTFDVDTSDIDEIRSTMLRLADGVARRLRRARLRARTVTLKYRDDSFRTRTRSKTLRTPTHASETVFQTAWREFVGLHDGGRVRLVGIYTSSFPSADQLQLFDEEDPTADRIRDAVAERFGSAAVTRARLLRDPRRGMPECEEDAPER